MNPATVAHILSMLDDDEPWLVVGPRGYPWVIPTNVVERDLQRYPVDIWTDHMIVMSTAQNDRYIFVHRDLLK